MDRVIYGRYTGADDIDIEAEISSALEDVKATRLCARLDNRAVAYALFAYLLDCDDKATWRQFLREALEESMSAADGGFTDYEDATQLQ